MASGCKILDLYQYDFLFHYKQLVSMLTFLTIKMLVEHVLITGQLLPIVQKILKICVVVKANCGNVCKMIAITSVLHKKADKHSHVYFGLVPYLKLNHQGA